MICNAKITRVSLNMNGHYCFTLDITLEGEGWGVIYGGYKLGTGALDSDTFEGSAKGMEAIMRIMDTVGVTDLQDMTGKYVRVELEGWGGTVDKIGNIIKDKWFSYKEFFRKEPEK